MRSVKSIPLDFTIDSLRKALSWGSQPETSPYTHEEIARWCDLMFTKFMDMDCEPEFDKAISIATSVDCQWDLYLANNFSLEDLQTKDLSQVHLPREWFEAWLNELNNETEQGAAANP